jgi:ADP-heptose:LPS heptosyltransferase
MIIRMPGGGIGDEVSTTPVVRELRRRMPRERFTLEGFRRREIYENNPHLVGGEQESGQVLAFEHGGPHMDAGSLPRKYALQAGFQLVDDTPEVFLWSHERVDTFGMTSWARTIAIDTWSRDSSRRWPFPRFQAVADALRADRWLVVEVGHHHGSELRGATSFLRKLSIRRTAAVMSRCTVYLGNDSGLFHLAAAVGTPQVVLFGLVSARYRAYWNTTGLGTVNRCQGCGANCSRGTPEGPACLSEIPAERVLEAVRLTARRFGRV